MTEIFHEGVLSWLRSKFGSKIRPSPQNTANLTQDRPQKYKKAKAPEIKRTSSKAKADLTQHFVNWTHDHNAGAWDHIQGELAKAHEPNNNANYLHAFADAISKYRDRNPKAWHHTEALHIMKHVFDHDGRPPKI